jgi:cell division protein FtsB
MLDSVARRGEGSGLRVLRIFSPGRILLVAIIIAAGYLTFSAGNHFANSFRLVNEEKRLESEVAALETELGQLEQVREYLRSDEYVEFMARRMFGLVKPGEKLVIVDAPRPPPPSDEELRNLSWWERLFAGY